MALREYYKVMHCVVTLSVSRRFSAPAVLLMCVMFAVAANGQPAGAPPAEPLTNLFQLRHQAERAGSIVRPFRIVADVIAGDAARGVLVLRDSSGAEFIRVGFTNRDVVPGSRVVFEGRGSAVERDGFGLAVVPAMVVENDGLHPIALESGKAFLRAGANPIRLKWFNRYGEAALRVEYEGPNLSRQPVPDSVLSRAQVDRATGRTNFLNGLDYRCYEGDWEFLPDFGKHSPAKTGIAANFDLGVLTRDQTVAVEFDGFITVPRDGVYTFHVASDDGSRLFLGTAAVDVRVVSEDPAPVAEPTVPSRLTEWNQRPWVTFEGPVESVGIWSVGGELWMRVGEDDIRVEVFDNGEAVTGIPQQGRVRATGIYEGVLTEAGARIPGRLLVLNWQAIQPVASGEHSTKPAGSDETAVLPAEVEVTGANGFPVPSTAAEVKALSPELAQQQIAVSIRGVVTAFTAKHSGAVIQDSTGGVFVDLTGVEGAKPVRRGEYCQIDGITGPGWFAPSVTAKRVTRIGPGRLPKPVRASWIQLMNGSLDAEYVEILGVVTAVQDRRLVLLTQGGKITVELRDFHPDVLPGYENALLRIRGCCFANFNMVTRKIEAGSLVMSGAAVDVLQRASADPFDAPQRIIGELLFYDPKAAPFRRLKVSGQVIYSRAGECYLTDGANGVHVITRDPERFGVGELVEAVGFLELGGHVAALKEALVRKTGHAPLVSPMELLPDQLLMARYAGTRVRIDATLINHWREAAEHVMELQSGFLAFRARISEGDQPIALPALGSRLELTGVHAPQGAKVSGGTVSRFDLLLSSPDGIRVLSTPPWWTLSRVLILAGILAALLLAVLIWNKELHWKVKKRGRQLEAEIRNRQRAEMEHAAEAERSRIARDLHDELGTSLTEVSLLSSASLGEFRDGEKYQERFRMIAEKARDLVSNLDVIVWAVDPKHNSVQSLADYIESYTRELLSASGIVFRCRIPIECGSVALSGTARHSLLLAIKEALNNVIRHAAATEVELQMSHSGEHIEIVIADNGRGFDWNAIRRGHGLTNLQERLKNLGGQCRIEPQPGKGTRIKLTVPLPGQSTSLQDSERSREIPQ